jgi:transposase
LNKINDILSRKKKGSKNFLQAQQHRQNYINWSINQINFSGVKILRIEQMKDLRRGKASSRKMSHWTYTLIFDKLRRKSLEKDVLLEEVNPTYTSQRCSNCGWTQKANRKGKKFKCKLCGFATDADFNASLNIANSELEAIPKQMRLEQRNRIGFYWNPSVSPQDEEPIVPHSYKNNICI